MSARQKAWLLPFAAPVLALGVIAGRVTPFSGWLLFACLSAGLAAALLRGRFRFAACLVFVLCAGFLSGSAAFHPALPEPGDAEVTGIVSDEFRPGAYGRQSAVLTHVTLDGKPAGAGAYWSFYPEELPADLVPGKQVSFRASVYHPSGPENPDGYNFREEMLRRGVTFCLYGAGSLKISEPDRFFFSGFTASVRHTLSAALTDRLGEEAGAYASALLLGIRTTLPSEDREAFSRLGIAHVLSVSGFHVGILVGLLALLFRFFGVPQRVRLLLYCVLLFFYSALCGLNQPVLRASLLVVLALEGKILNRPRSGLHLLSAAFCILVLFSPAQLTGVSFQMTFAAMLGLTLVTPWLSDLCPFSGKRVRRLWASFSVFLGAQLGVLFPVLYYYQSFPLLGLLMNLPAALIGSAVIVADWIVLLLLPVPFLSGLFGKLVAACTLPLLHGIRALSALPGITLWTPAPSLWTALGLAGLLFSLSFLFRIRPRVRLSAAAVFAAVVVLSLLPHTHSATEYIQFSAGNADAAVLWDQENVYVLDTGYADGTVSAFLKRRRLTPDAVILTHLHTDHAAGLQSLLAEGIPVSVVYLPEGAEKAEIHEDMAAMLAQLREAGVEIRTLSRGDRIPLPSGSLSVLWPESGRVRPGQDANHSCLVTLLNLNGTTLLQASDLTGEYEMYSAVQADILKMAHHGSAGSTSPEFLQAVSPQAVLLSCERMQRHETVLERLEGIPLYSTAACGAVTVRFGDRAWTVEPFIVSGLEVTGHGTP